MTETSPTAQRREVGTLLRAHRERVGLMLAEAAEQAGVSAAKLSRLERGLRGLHVADVRTLCGLYRLSEEETRELLSATRASREPGWWEAFSGLADSAPMFFGLELAASRVEEYDSLCVPGVLQTAAYALALLRRIRPPGSMSDDSVAELVEAVVVVVFDRTFGELDEYLCGCRLRFEHQNTDVRELIDLTQLDRVLSDFFTFGSFV